MVPEINSLNVWIARHIITLNPHRKKVSSTLVWCPKSAHCLQLKFMVNNRSNLLQPWVIGIVLCVSFAISGVPGSPFQLHTVWWPAPGREAIRCTSGSSQGRLMERVWGLRFLYPFLQQSKLQQLTPVIVRDNTNKRTVSLSTHTSLIWSHCRKKHNNCQCWI